MHNQTRGHARFARGAGTAATAPQSPSHHRPVDRERVRITVPPSTEAVSVPRPAAPGQGMTGADPDPVVAGPRWPSSRLSELADYDRYFILIG